MPYPTDIPKNKHELQCSQSLPAEDSSTLISEMGFAKTSQLFQALQQQVVESPPKALCPVYSYPDGPDRPGPLSRSLIIMGFADSSIR